MENHSLNKIKFFRAAAFALCFFVSGFFVSKCFAQSSQPDSRSKQELSNEYIRTFAQIFYTLQNRYVEEVDPEVLYKGALKGMMDSLGDPYTVYLDVQDMRSLNDTTEGAFYGVGLSISKRNNSTPENPAYVDVVSPIQGTPGFKAGIQAGDKLIEINGEPTPEMSMETVLSKLRGPKGEGVEVTVLRGKSVTFKRTLIRDLIEVPTVEYGMIGNYGYMKLIQFTPETVLRVQDAIDFFDEKKYKGLVIDLRNNPGGLLDSAAKIADKFIDAGPIVSTKSRLPYESRSINASEKNTVVKNIPIVVLINRGSASASEILSGALKDNHLAYLVGERTYGKGSVQQVMPLNHGDGIKITVARYYTPSDTNIDKIGIPPDKEVALSPQYTDEQTKALIKLSEEETIRKYVESHPDMDEKEIANYASELQKDFGLDLRLLRRLIRIEVGRTKEPQLYDLDFDVQLNAALEILREGNFKKLVRSTKTLKELQEEAEAADALSEKNSSPAQNEN
ncbi:MAG: S41 family peptidase [Treponemataceae bacterium]|nr:S41 family peptidase [Treponemataceae bacterium]